MTRTGGRHEAGFSLIEALVALAILAVGAAGLIRATEAHVDTIRGLQRRTAALWVAENRLAEIDAGIPGGGRVAMLGASWDVTTAGRATDDPDLRAVTVKVAPAGEAVPLVTLDGFRDAGTTTVAAR